MLTAVSVARECGMIPTQSRAIVIKASFASTATKPRLSYHAVGETTDQMHLLRSNSMSGTSVYIHECTSIHAVLLLYSIFVYGVHVLHSADNCIDPLPVFLFSVSLDISFRVDFRSS